MPIPRSNAKVTKAKAGAKGKSPLKGKGRPMAKSSGSSSSGSKKRGEKDVYDDEDADDTKRGLRNHKQRAHGDEGEDSDDNDGNGGRVKRGDDESVDDDASDIGWDSDDELAYGKELGKDRDGDRARDEESDESESDQEDPREGEILLSDMLGGSKTAPKSPSSSTAATRMKGSAQGNKANAASALEKAAAAMEEDSGGEDESDFEYDYEEKLGLASKSKKGTGKSIAAAAAGAGGSMSESGSEDDSEDDEEDDEEDDLEEVHSRLLSAIDRFAAPVSTDKKGKRQSLQGADESQFSATAEAWSGQKSSAVTMDALLGALDGEAGLAVVKQRLSDLERGLSAPVYVEKVISDRAERTVAYDTAQTDMSKWQSVVVSNRNARTLDIAQDQRVVPNYKNLVRQHEAATEMEREIAMVLVQTGATEAAAAKKEEDELGKRNLTVAELRERQAELAKTKALLFYEQMKKHRINKIKSKSYHRIKKRARARKGQETALLAENDPELLRKLEEEAAMKRVKERMDFRHKSTGKFAQNMLRHGKGNTSMREAYNESVLLGNELSARIHEDVSKEAGSSESEDSGSDDEAGKKKKIAARASKALRAAGVLGSSSGGASGEGGDSEEPQVTGKYKKLFEMDFMKKAKEQQKERAREEAQSVLREIEEMEGRNESDDSEDDGSNSARVRKASNRTAPDAAAVAAAKQAMEGLFQSSNSMSLKGRKVTFTSDDPVLPAAAASGAAANGKMNKKAKARQAAEEAAAAAGGAAIESNPWLAGPATGNKRKSNEREDGVHAALDGLIGAGGSSSGSGSGSGKRGMVDASAKASAKKQKKEAAATTAASYAAVAGADGAAAKAPESISTEVKAEKKALLEGKSQQDLVKIAFAGPDLEDEFQSYKEKQVDSELGIDAKKKKIMADVKAGWGDWAGPGQGAGFVSAKITKKRDRLVASAEAEADEKRKSRGDTKTPNVMMSDRRVKTAAKFKIADVPHPFTSREEYEKSLVMPIGEEWNASHVVRQNTKPDMFLRAGRVVEPLKLSKNHEKTSAVEYEKAKSAAGGAGSGKAPMNDKFTLRKYKGF